MKTVVVTGGSGFVGRNLIRGLGDAGFTARALARGGASQQRVETLVALAVRGDVLDEPALSEGMHGCRGLVHAAADTNNGAATAEQERVNTLCRQSCPRLFDPSSKPELALTCVGWTSGAHPPFPLRSGLLRAVQISENLMRNTH